MEGSPAGVVRNAPRMKPRSPVVAPSASRPPPRVARARASSDAPNLAGRDGGSVRGSSDAAPLGVDDDALATAEAEAERLKERFAFATDAREREEALRSATEAQLRVNVMRAERAFTPEAERRAAASATARARRRASTPRGARRVPRRLRPESLRRDPRQPRPPPRVAVAVASASASAWRDRGFLPRDGFSPRPERVPGSTRAFSNLQGVPGDLRVPERPRGVSGETFVPGKAPGRVPGTRSSFGEPSALPRLRH